MSFAARYGGACAECPTEICEGDQIEVLNGLPVHVECLPEELLSDEVVQPRRYSTATCPECWQTKALTGACGCE